MPIAGTLPLTEDGLPEVADFGTDPLTLERADVLQVMYEIDAEGMEAMLPAALHPTIPPTVTWVFWRAPSSPWGAFTLAQTRVGCRAGVRPRGYLLSAVIDNESAGAELSRRWGFRCEAGDVSLKRFYDRVVGRA